MIQLKPLQDFVLILVDSEQEKKGAVFVKEDWKSLPPTGTIKAVGPDVKSLKPGMNVQFERYSSIILADDYRLAKENSVYGEVTDATA